MKRYTQAEVRAAIHAAIARLETAAMTDDPSEADAMIRWAHLELGKLRRADWGRDAHDAEAAFAAGAERCHGRVQTQVGGAFTDRRCVLPDGHRGTCEIVGAAEAHRRGLRVADDWRCPTCSTPKVARITEAGLVTCEGGHVSQ